MLLARISLTLSRHFSLLFIASGRSSGLHPVSSHSCWMYVQAGRPAFARPHVGVHRIDKLSIIWKSDLNDKMKLSFFQAAVVSILLYGCTTWTLTKRLEKKLDGNYTRMLQAILNKSWCQHPTMHQLYDHLPPITKTIQVRWTRHAGHCWRSRDELISDVLLWTPTYGRTKAGRPARTYIQHLCEYMGCGPEDRPEAMNDREKWRERVRDIRACNMTWWWWYKLLQRNILCLSIILFLLIGAYFCL